MTALDTLEIIRIPDHKSNRLMFSESKMRATLLKSLGHTLLLSLILASTSLVLGSQNPDRESGILSELWARKSAVNAEMPLYPDEAVRREIAGLVRIKIETAPEGNVTRIKVKPLTDLLLRKAVVDSVKRWRFRPSRGASSLSTIVFSRLTFNFVIDSGGPRVEMYDPGPHPPEGECLGCTNSSKELREWNEWDEVWSSSETDGFRPGLSPIELQCRLETGPM